MLRQSWTLVISTKLLTEFEQSAVGPNLSFICTITKCH